MASSDLDRSYEGRSYKETLPSSAHSGRRFDELYIQPSLYLKIFIVLSHVFGFLCISLLNLATMWQLILALLVGLSALHAWRVHIVACPSRLWYRDTDAGDAGNGSNSSREGWFCEIGQGEVESLTLLPDSLLWSWLIVLRCRAVSGGLAKKQTRTVLLLPDSGDKDDLRRLRVLLNTRCKN